MDELEAYRKRIAQKIAMLSPEKKEIAMEVLAMIEKDEANNG